jgi:hypothetical protein
MFKLNLLVRFSKELPSNPLRRRQNSPFTPHSEVLANGQLKIGGFASYLASISCERADFKEFLMSFFTARFRRREAVEKGDKNQVQPRTLPVRRYR